MPDPLFWLLLPVHACAAASLGIVHLLQGRGLASLRGGLAGVRGIRPFLRDRKIVQKARRAGPGGIMAHLTWSPFALLSRAGKVRSLAS